jgi:hypothetical protein
VQLDVISDRHDTLELLVDAHTTNDALRAGMRKVRVLACKAQESPTAADSAVAYSMAY